jgi:cell division protein FtsL
MLVLLALMNYIEMILIVGIVFTLPVLALVTAYVCVQLSEQKENCQKKALEIEYETCYII